MEYNAVFPNYFTTFRRIQFNTITMKKLTTFLLSAFISTITIAQTLPSSGGPDGFGYTFKNSNDPNGPTYQWFDISTIGTQVFGLGDDNFVGPFPISGFTYYSSNPTQFWIGSNGFISFNPVNIASTNAQFPIIPTVGGPNDYIAPFMSDLNFGGTNNPGKVFIYDSGDTLCVSFNDVPFWVNNSSQFGGNNTFQVILNRADSSITFNHFKQVGAPEPTAYTNNYISSGIENATGIEGLQYYRGDTIAGIVQTAVKFSFPTIIQPFTDAEVNWVDNTDNSGKIFTTNHSFSPTANIKNAGNQDITTSFNVSYHITNSSGAIVNLGSKSISSLATGADTTITLGNSYTFSNPGQYVFTSFLNGVSSDFISSNDTNKMLIVVVDTTITPTSLSYHNGVPSINGIGWSGGNGGVATYLEPPYYPAKVVGTNFYITANAVNPVGFYSLLYDDGGRTSPQGALLDSAYFLPSNIFTQSYNYHSITNNVTITSGGVYLLWLMAGDGISLGRNIANPASRHTYEVLFGTWSNYRDADSEDFLMGIEIQPISVGINQAENETNTAIYPNPANEFVWIENIKDDVKLSDFQLFSIEGKKVNCKILKYNNKIQIIRGDLKMGTYYLKFGNTSTKIIFAD